MGVLDKFLDVMKLNDDEFDDEDFFDEEFEEEDFEEEKPKRSLFGGKRKKAVEEDDFEEVSDLPAKSSRNKVTPMRQPKRGQAMEVCVINPNSIEDAREITEKLLGGSAVVLNLEGLDLEIAQRIIDFTSGATYAIDGNLQKISNYIFLVTPTFIAISGDMQDLLSTSFEASSVRTRF